MMPRQLGLVSNCWKIQLDQGESLVDLISRASLRDLRAIELRQGSLGEFEKDLAQADVAPSAARAFEDLAARHPAMTLNLALSLPCFDGTDLLERPDTRAGLAAARALTPVGQFHFRIVDIQTRSPTLSAETRRQVVGQLTKLADRVSDLGGSLSLENAYQDWSTFWSVLNEVQSRLKPTTARVRCCLDPCNLLLTQDPESIEETIAGVAPIDVAMIHLKQRAQQQIQPGFGPGDVNWNRLLEIFHAWPESIPWLLEVAPHASFWDNLTDSLAFLRAFQESHGS